MYIPVNPQFYYIKVEFKGGGGGGGGRGSKLYRYVFVMFARAFIARTMHIA